MPKGRWKSNFPESVTDELPIIDTEAVHGVICPLRLTSELDLNPGTAH